MTEFPGQWHAQQKGSGVWEDTSEGTELLCQLYSNDWAGGTRQPVRPKEASQNLFIPALQLTPHLPRKALLPWKSKTSSSETRYIILFYSGVGESPALSQNVFFFLSVTLLNTS